MKYQYLAQGKNRSLKLIKNLIAVRFKEPTPHSKRLKAALKAGVKNFKDRIEIPKEKYTILPVEPTTDSLSKTYTKALKKLEKNTNIIRVAPVFKAGSMKVVATNRIIVGLKNTSQQIKKIAKKVGGTIIDNWGDNYLIQVQDGVCPFTVITQIREMNLADYVQPDFVHFGNNSSQPYRNNDPLSGNYSDELLSKQYALKITKTMEAWPHQVGDKSIRIAILDDGIDTLHEDLNETIADSYDATDGDRFQEPEPLDVHGTQCAGLAVATANNKGIRGVGYGCSLLAVRFTYKDSEGNQFYTDATFAKAIEWSWNKGGASIISISSERKMKSDPILYELKNALTKGRNGDGCVIVAAAGNGDMSPGGVKYPGKYPDVLTVSATDENDEFQTYKSYVPGYDPEYNRGRNWTSNQGREVDIAAPGVNIITTYPSGKGTVHSNYAIFNGTSASTPIVAGAAGLVLSANNTLKEHEVRKILTDTADKVGPKHGYTNGHSIKYGYGRLNALEAVKKAQWLMRPTQQLTGTVKQLQMGSRPGAAFFLKTDSDEYYLLHHHSGEEAGESLKSIENDNLTYLAQFDGKQCNITYVSKQTTSYGTILWGVDIHC